MKEEIEREKAEEEQVEKDIDKKTEEFRKA